MNLDDILERRLQETYEHLMPYLHIDENLQRTCANCEYYMGEEHDYSECRHNQCFINYLGLKRLEWEISFRGYYEELAE